MDVGPVWHRVPDEVRAQAWTLIKAGYHLEADRILLLELGDAFEAKAVVAWLVKRKLGIHN